MTNDKVTAPSPITKLPQIKLRRFDWLHAVRRSAEPSGALERRRHARFLLAHQRHERDIGERSSRCHQRVPRGRLREHRSQRGLAHRCLGAVHPDQAHRFANPGFVNFLFGGSGLVPTDDSAFFFLDTKATAYAKIGSYDFTGTGGNGISVSYATFAPVPEPSSVTLLVAGLPTVAWIGWRVGDGVVASRAQPKPFVVLGRNLRADLPILRHPAGVRHEDTRLAGDVRAEIPRVLRLRQQRRVGRRVDLRDP